jgi:hypothetical protein
MCDTCTLGQSIFKLTVKQVTVASNVPLDKNSVAPNSWMNQHIYMENPKASASDNLIMLILDHQQKQYQETDQ